MFIEKISTYTCIQALKCRMQALFLMQIQNFKSDFRDFDFLLFLGIKSESNQKHYILNASFIEKLISNIHWWRSKVTIIFMFLGWTWAEGH